MHRPDTVRKLRTLAAFLRRLQPEQFNYRYYVDNPNFKCLTTCCAAGWVPAIWPELIPEAWRREYRVWEFQRMPVTRFLGLDNREWDRLFMPFERGVNFSPLRGSATAQQVADYLDAQASHLAKHGVLA